MAVIVREHESLRPRQYLLLGLVLTVITIIELAVSYSGMAFPVLVTVLLTLSAVKFALVVAFFMHLRFESAFVARLFLGPLALASAILLALIALFVLDLR